MESVHGQDDRKRERHAMDGVWLPADGDQPGTRSLPGSRHTPGPGGPIGVWTGLIIPAPIWREGMDSPSGCGIMDDVTKGAGPFAPLPPRQRQVGKSTKLTRAEVNQSESGFEIRKREWNIVPRW